MIAAVERTRYLDENEARRLLTVTEAWAVLDAQAGRLRGGLVWAVVDTAMLTGLRVSEIARLTVADLDAKRGLLHVFRHKRRAEKREVLAIPPELVEHLAAFTAGREGPIFVGKRGSLSVSGLETLWKVAVKRAGLPKEYSIHSARHTVAVTLLKKTGNLRMVQKQLGHASPTTTANLYADVSHEDMAAGVTGLYNKKESEP